MLKLADEAAKFRSLPLNFRIGKPEVRVDNGARTTNVSLLIDPKNRSFEHDAAHELCHVTAGCCGFSYNIGIAGEALLPKANSPLDRAVGRLAIVLGNVFTHAAVHQILQAAGYDRADWDSHLLVDLGTEIEAQKNLPIARGDTLDIQTEWIGWAIQYEELARLRLPGLDIKSFKEKLGEYFALLDGNFDADFRLVRESTQIDNVLQVQGCLKSTRSLAAAFGKLLGYPVEKRLTIEIACEPSKDWSLDAVTKRLREAKG